MEFCIPECVDAIRNGFFQTGMGRAIPECFPDSPLGKFHFLGGARASRQRRIEVVDGFSKGTPFSMTASGHATQCPGVITAPLSKSAPG
jgi:hypothetical protein